MISARRSIIPLIAGAVGIALGGCAANGPPARSNAVVFVNVDVVPMDADHVLERQDVLIRDGIIDAVGPSGSLPIPAQAERIDGAGRFLMPALVDAHVHLRSHVELLSYLAHGVTSVVHLSGPTGDVDDVLALRAEVARGNVLGPTIYTSGRIIDGDPPINPSVSSVARTPEEAERLVAGQIASGVDFIKVYNNLSPQALRATLDTAHRSGMAVFGHLPRAGGRDTALQRALDGRLDVIAHAEEIFFTFFYQGIEDQLDRGMVPIPAYARVPSAVQLIRDAGSIVTPNLSFIAATRSQLDDMERVLADSEARFLSASVRETWRQQNPTTRPDLPRFDRRERAKYAFVQTLTKALSDANVSLLLGTDASAPGLYPGESAHLELAELVKAGLTPYQALATATRTAGTFLSSRSATAALGTITTGSRADLLLLRQNPLIDIANARTIVGIMVRGEWHPLADIQARRNRAVD